MISDHQPRSTVRADLQGLRGLAILLVVGFHSGVGPAAGFLGVDVFMVLSGFVIGAMLLREVDNSGTLSLRTFYARRARRLLPALATLIVTVTIINLFVMSPLEPQQLAIRTAAASTAFASNLFLYRHSGYFDSAADMNSFLHLWSLAVEEQFYLVLPAVVLTVNRIRSGRAALALVVGGLSVGSLLLSLGLTRGWFTLGLQAPARLAFFSMPTRFWEFGVGILLALGAVRIPLRWMNATGALGAIGLAIPVVMVDPGSPHPDLVAVVVAAATAALIAAGTPGIGNPRDGAFTTVTSRALASAPLVWLGDRSYAWFLWHWPAIVIARIVWPASTLATVAAAAAALGPAVISTRYIERPFRLNNSIIGWRAARLTLTCILLPLVVLMAGLRLADTGLGLDPQLGWSDLPMGRRVGCNHFNRDGIETWPGQICTTTPPGATGTVLILGDLHADSVSPGVIEAATKLRLGTALWTRSGCPMSTATPVHSPDCERWKSDAFELVDQIKPAAVVIANHSYDYTGDVSSEIAISTASGRHPASATEARRLWADGLDSMLARFDERSIPVVLVGDAPDFGPGFPVDRISLINPTPTVPRLTRDEVRGQLAEVVAAEQQVTAKHRNSRWIDPTPRICPVSCSPLRSGTWIYYDGRHLTTAGSKRLTTDLLPALRAATDPGR